MQKRTLRRKVHFGRKRDWPRKKGRPEGLPLSDAKYSLALLGRLLRLRLGRLGLLRLLGRGRFPALLLALLVLLLGLVLGAEQLHDGHLGAVTAAGSEPQDARVAARAGGVARAQALEELL